jgi:type IV pilus assembly protein PilE
MKRNGFTLIELMIVVAIVGIIAGIAVPAYQDSISKSRRRDAEGALQGLANAMERHFTEHNSYLGAADGGADTGSTATIFSDKSPVDGSTAYYALSITAAGVSTFTIQASPLGAQADDKCGTLSLDNTGTRGVSNLSVDQCW